MWQRERDCTPCRCFLKNCGKRILVLSCLSVCPHRRTGLILDWFSINITFWRFFEKYVEIFQVWLTSDKKKSHFTWRLTNICENTSLKFYYEKCFTQNLQKKSKLTFYVLFLNSCRLGGYIGKDGSDTQATDDNIIRRWQNAIFKPDDERKYIDLLIICTRDVPKVMSNNCL